MEAEPLAALVIVSATLLFLFIKMLVVMAGEDRDTIAAFVKERQGRLIDAKRLMFGVSLRAEEPARTYDVSRFIGDPTRARALLGWQADTSIELGMARLVADLSMPVGPSALAVQGA